MTCEGYSFDSFQVSVPKKLLTRGNRREKIQPVPFQMLLMLLENRGEIVDKKDLVERLWGKGHGSQAENGLYVVAARLREILGDDASSPRFIETVPGRGYTFIAKVTPLAILPIQHSPAPAEIPELHQDANTIDPSPYPPEAGDPRLGDTLPKYLSRILPPSSLAPHVKRFLRARSELAVWSGATAILFGAVTLSISIYGYSSRPLVGDQGRIVFAGFTNSTGDHDLDSTVGSASELKLRESPYLSVIPDQQFRDTLRRPEVATLQEELSGCALLDAKVLVKGRITKVDAGFHIQLAALSCSGGRLLTTQMADAPSESSILPALDLATERLRLRLGESKASVERFKVPLRQATTASLAALAAFTRGEQLASRGNTSEAIDSFQIAVHLDRQFALAYARLGGLYYNTDQHTAYRQAFQQAFDLRDHATDHEKMYIVSSYYDNVRGEKMMAIQAYEVWHTLYPRDPAPINNLAVAYLSIGRAKEALELSRSAIQLDPTNIKPHLVLAEAYLKLGDYRSVSLTCNDPAYVRTDVTDFHRICYRAAFALNDDAGMQQQLSWARGKAGESVVIDDAAWGALSRGRLAEASARFADAKRIALLNDSNELASDVEIEQAVLDADIGLNSAAREHAAAGIRGSSRSAIELARTALARARVGDEATAQDLSKEARSLAPSDTIINSVLLPSVIAAISLSRDDGEPAIEVLAQTRPYDQCSEMELSIGYYRGLAYLERGQPENAVKEFQQVVDHSSLADFPFYVMLSRLEMGRALRLLGKNVLAEQVFRALEDGWKNADRDFPPLQRLRSYHRGSVSQITDTEPEVYGARKSPNRPVSDSATTRIHMGEVPGNLAQMNIDLSQGHSSLVVTK